MKFQLFSVGVLVAGCLSACPTQAATETFNTSTPVPGTLTDWTGSVAFPQFDSSLGTLNSVRLDFSGSLSTVLTVQNMGSAPSRGWVSTEVQFAVNDSGNNLNAVALDINPMSSSTVKFFYSNLAPGNSVSGSPVQNPMNASQSGLYTAAPVLAEFTGGGNIDLSASSSTLTWFGYTGGNISATQVSYASLDGSVTYDYTPAVAAIPEPATLVSLSGLGFLALGRVFKMPGRGRDGRNNLRRSAVS